MGVRTEYRRSSLTIPFDWFEEFNVRNGSGCVVERWKVLSIKGFEKQGYNLILFEINELEPS